MQNHNNFQDIYFYWDPKESKESTSHFNVSFISPTSSLRNLPPFIERDETENYKKIMQTSTGLIFLVDHKNEHNQIYILHDANKLSKHERNIFSKYTEEQWSGWIRSLQAIKYPINPIHCRTFWQFPSFIKAIEKLPDYEQQLLAIVTTGDKAH